MSIFLSVLLGIIISTTQLAFATESQTCEQLVKEHYPHWNQNDPKQCEYLLKLEKFVAENKDQKPLAIFDWDGTLYGENIKVKEYKGGGMKAGQPVWHIWAAYHMDKFKELNLLPMLRTAESKNERIKNIVRKDDYLEGKLDQVPSGYDKFSQIATFEAGMTPENITRGVEMYLNDYDPCKFAIYPAMDVAQRLADAKFSIWIVTGSSPYYVATVLDTIEKKCEFKPNARYALGVSSIPYSADRDKIVGNTAKLLENGELSNVYEDMFTRKGSDGKLLIIEKDGKRVALQNYIEPKTGHKALFCGGNSAGDKEAMQYVLSRDHSLGMFVNPRGGLEKIFDQFADRSLKILFTESH